MEYKVAVASSDGKVINHIFKRAEQFLIFGIDEDRCRFLESRVNNPSCVQWEYSKDTLDYTARLISDCKYVLTSRIDRKAADYLLHRGIKAYSISEYIEDAFKRIIRHDNKNSTRLSRISKEKNNL